ncbi:hypothetical protein TNCV_2293501 [Trichonephila clavipes]|nr:hypothetical protein TNCV_2293501 [Trichonephila clavipes]
MFRYPIDTVGHSSVNLAITKVKLLIQNTHIYYSRELKTPLWIPASKSMLETEHILRNQYPEQPPLALITAFVRLGVESNGDWLACTGFHRARITGRATGRNKPEMQRSLFRVPSMRTRSERVVYSTALLTITAGFGPCFCKRCRTVDADACFLANYPDS